MSPQDLIVAGFVFALVIAVGYFIQLLQADAERQKSVRKRLSRAIGPDSPLGRDGTILMQSGRRKRVEVSKLPFIGSVTLALRKAGLRWVKWWHWFIAVAVVSFVWTWFFSWLPIVFILEWSINFAAFHLLGERYLLGWLGARQTRAILNALPIGLDLAVRGLRVGQPIETAIRTIALEMDGRIQEIFAEVVERLNIGESVTEALREVGREVDVREFDFFVSAVTIHIETGGNLSDTLAELATTLRQRNALRLKVQALAAEGQASAIVVSAMPVLLLIYFRYNNPEYVAPLFDTTIGNLVLGGAMLLIVIGAIVMNKIASIKV